MTVNVGGACFDQTGAALSEPESLTRRSLLGRGSLLIAAGGIGLRLGSNVGLAKKKKNKDKDKDKKKQKDKSLSVHDFVGNWLTAQSNGITGNLSFFDDNLPHSVEGIYSSTQGAGTIHCTIHGDHGKTLHCRYAQGDGKTGGFIATLNGKNSWIGDHFPDGGAQSLITGVRSKH